LFAGVGILGTLLVVVPFVLLELAESTISFIWIRTGGHSLAPIISTLGLAASTIQMQGLGEYFIF
jgi:hypothetical protein